MIKKKRHLKIKLLSVEHFNRKNFSVFTHLSIHLLYVGVGGVCVGVLEVHICIVMGMDRYVPHKPQNIYRDKMDKL